MKKFDLGIVKVQMHPNGFVKGLILKRELTLHECRYLMRKFLGINISTKEDFDYASDFLDYNRELITKVNDWLKGDIGDDKIIEYAYNCADEQLGLMNLIPIISWLKQNDIID